MKRYLGETIAAIATPPGEGGMGMIRVSGDEALDLVQRIFRPSSSSPRRVEEWESHRLRYGHIVDPETGERLDEVMVAVLRRPRSYTREDMAEISCHGGPAILTALLELAIREGARLADPGEFTRRAFLNGRIDLTQAEAVMDLIRSRGPAGRRLAMSQLEGALSQEVKSIREKLLGALARLEVALDFPEEDLDPLNRRDLEEALEGAASAIQRLLMSYASGRIMREGVAVVIVGCPNVGKSSLMNRLLQDERVIVSPYPGTTRDVISEQISLGGIAVSFHDTAGLGTPSDPLEAEGIRRTRRELREGDLIIAVIDGSMDLSAQDEEILSTLTKEEKPTIVALNKMDLACRIAPETLEERFRGNGRPFAGEARTGTPPTSRVYPLSALQDRGIQELREGVEKWIRAEMETPASGAVLCRLRHLGLLHETQRSLMDARNALRDGLPDELASLGLKEAIDRLGEMVGIVCSDELLDRIFRDFCVGK